MGCTRGPVGSSRKGRERLELRYELVFKSVLVVRTWWFCGCELENLVDLTNLRKALQRGPQREKNFSFVGGSASPFIDKGDGFTSEGTYANELCCPCRRVQDNGRRLQHY